MTMMFIQPLNIPADPRPAMALPTIKALEFGAEPQTVDCQKRKLTRITGGGKSTYTNLEDGNSSEQDPFGRVERINASIYKLESTSSQ
jgi:hypothetical protein